MKADHLLVRLTSPSAAMWANASADEELLTNLGEYRSVLSDWSTLPDVLVVPDRRELVGLTFYFANPMDPKLRFAELAWDRRFVRIVHPGDRPEAYPQGFDAGVYLEVYMKHALGAVQQLAQLDFSEFGWLFECRKENPSGFAIWDAAEVAQNHGARLPSDPRR